MAGPKAILESSSAGRRAFLCISLKYGSHIGLASTFDSDCGCFYEMECGSRPKSGNAPAMATKQDFTVICSRQHEENMMSTRFLMDSRRHMQPAQHMGAFPNNYLISWCWPPRNSENCSVVSIAHAVQDALAPWTTGFVLSACGMGICPMNT